MGAEALYEICKDLELDKMTKELRTQIRSTRSKQLKKKAIKRLRVVDDKQAYLRLTDAEEQAERLYTTLRKLFSEERAKEELKVKS